MKSISTYQHLEEKLQQQEQTITQLLAILAATNTKVTELSLRQSEYEKTLHHYFLASRVSVSP